MHERRVLRELTWAAAATGLASALGLFLVKVWALAMPMAMALTVFIGIVFYAVAGLVWSRIRTDPPDRLLRQGEVPDTGSPLLAEKSDGVEKSGDSVRGPVAYDDAVERGRLEERQRIAQDLHDDIGARLLTLMYQAPTREMEDYIRHTLLDLKTLTRGLAASEHRLSHAAAEWKADLAHRLSLAQVTLGWHVHVDRDRVLTMVQWSALTRVLRELVTNAIYHGHATQLDVSLTLRGPRLVLQVSDDGDGRAPETWAHGLGLGGVRKRVKLLGGEVEWREHAERGIVCELRVSDFAAPAAAPQAPTTGTQ